MKQSLLDPGECIYCSIPFGTKVIYKGQTRWVTEIREHFNPRVNGGNNHKSNIVRACGICNSIKGSKCFASATEAQLHILGKLLKTDFRVLQYPTYAVKLGPRKKSNIERIRILAGKLGVDLNDLVKSLKNV